MKKKLIILGAIFVLLIGSLFTLTGCSKITTIMNKNTVKIGNETFKLDRDMELKNIHYKENYDDFYIDDWGNSRTMSYEKHGNLFFKVRVTYKEKSSVSEVKQLVESQYTKAKEQSKKINGVKYIYYEYTDDGLTAHQYIYEYSGRVYIIGFFLSKNSGNIEEVFMNNVKFE